MSFKRNWVGVVGSMVLLRVGCDVRDSELVAVEEVGVCGFELRDCACVDCGATDALVILDGIHMWCLE